MPPAALRSLLRAPLLLGFAATLGGSALAQDIMEPPPEAKEVIVTATGFDKDPFETSYSTFSLDEEFLRTRVRSLPESLQRVPGVQVQKTAYGQTSVYVRGFTGFRVLHLVDGIRLNHTAMREGPNQYFGTIDYLIVERLELVRGPSSVLYGSDAIGGTINAVTRKAAVGPPGSGTRVGGGLYARFATAEQSFIGRAEVAVNDGADWGLLAGASGKWFGNLRAGGDSNELLNTRYTEGDGDARFDRYLANGVYWTLAFQTVRQQDVPRTHTTVFAVPFHGTDVGTELQRTHDQVRDLIYGRVGWDAAGGLFDEAEITLSLQHQGEDRYRLRTGGREDVQDFNVYDLGLLARFETEGGDTGVWSYGFEGHYETVDSSRTNYVGGVPQPPPPVQGPVGDDSYAYSLAAYVQDELFIDDFSIVPGLRLNYNAIESKDVTNITPPPASMSVADRWTALVGSLRGNWFFGTDDSVFGGVSQGFRAPSLHDLTALDATSTFELPNPNLNPEHYVQAELGTKGIEGPFRWQASIYRTWIRNQIIASPTGAYVGPTPVVMKSNIGDGTLDGIDFDFGWQIAEQWSTYVGGTWQRGDVDQFQASTNSIVSAPISRLSPLQVTTGLRWEQRDPQIWVEGWVWAVDKQDRLALRDVTDTQRIPADGTPGYTVFGLSSGWQVNDRVLLAMTLDNWTNQDYRVHGSGVNGPGINLSVTVEVTI